MCSAAGDGTPSRRVSPFGHPRIEACVRLPEAFRSLPRPSSAQSTEASTIRPYSLDRPPGFPGAPAPRRVRRSQRPALLRIHHPSHTSAAPLPCVLRSRALALCACQGANLVETGGIEPPPSCLQSRRSIRLSYVPGYRHRIRRSAHRLATEQCVGRLGENDERLPIDLRAFATNEQLAPPPRDPARP